MNRQGAAVFMLSLLTLLVSPKLPNSPPACQVLFIDRGRVVLQCPARQEVETDGWVRLQPVSQRPAAGQ